MSVHYKFKSAMEYDTLPLDGVNISLEDLKEAIIEQKRLGNGKRKPFDLQITNAETNEVYTDDNTLIPKNSELIVARVPMDPLQWKKKWENGRDSTALILSNPSNLINTLDGAEAADIDRKMKQHTDLTQMTGSEDDRINAMMAQSTFDYHPSKYMKLRNSNMVGKVPKEYKCYKCHQHGHWVKNCPLNNLDLRKSTGIPSMFLKEVKDATVPGAMITAQGKFVISLLQVDMDKFHNKDQAPVDRPIPPPDLVCGLCKELLKEAVLIPCCAAAFCDECIRDYLLEHSCPSCSDDSTRPEMLIPNRYLRSKCKEFDINGVVQLTTSFKSLPKSQRDSSTPPASPESPLRHDSPCTNSLQTLLGSPTLSTSQDEKDTKHNVEGEEIEQPILEEEGGHHMYEFPPGIAVYNPLVLPPGAYHKTSPQHSNVVEEEIELPILEEEGGPQMYELPPGVAEYNPLVPPPLAYHNTSPQHHTSRYIDQDQFVEDPLAAFNKLMLEKDMERAHRRGIKRRQPSKSRSRSPMNRGYRSHRDHSKFLMQEKDMEKEHKPRIKRSRPSRSRSRSPTYRGYQSRRDHSKTLIQGKDIEREHRRRIKRSRHSRSSSKCPKYQGYRSRSGHSPPSNRGGWTPQNHDLGHSRPWSLKRTCY